LKFLLFRIELLLVIQLSDSEDESSSKLIKNQSLDETLCNKKIDKTLNEEKNKAETNYDNNQSQQNNVNDLNDKASKPKSDKNKYYCREWDIKRSDTISINKYLISENHSIKRVYTGGFELKSKFTRLGGYFSDVEHMIIFNEKNGIDLIIKDGDYQIKITIGIEDIKYCAAMFHDPAFFLFIRLSDFTASLYAEELKKMDSYRKGFSYCKNGRFHSNF
jgi:hypothetical protein